MRTKPQIYLHVLTLNVCANLFAEASERSRPGQVQFLGDCRPHYKTWIKTNEQPPLNMQNINIKSSSHLQQPIQSVIWAVVHLAPLTKNFFAIGKNWKTWFGPLLCILSTLQRPKIRIFSEMSHIEISTPLAEINRDKNIYSCTNVDAVYICARENLAAFMKS